LYDLALHLRLEHESAYNNIDSNTIPATRGDFKVNFQTIYENGGIIIKCNDCTYLCNIDTINAMEINKHAKTPQNELITNGLKGNGLKETNENGSVAYGYYTIKYQNILSFICCECNYRNKDSFGRFKDHTCIDTHTDFISEKVRN
jgi:hypothetical protein